MEEDMLKNPDIDKSGKEAIFASHLINMGRKFKEGVRKLPIDEDGNVSIDNLLVCLMKEKNVKLIKK